MNFEEDPFDQEFTEELSSNLLFDLLNLFNYLGKVLSSMINPWDYPVGWKVRGRVILNRINPGEDLSNKINPGDDPQGHSRPDKSHLINF